MAFFANLPYATPGMGLNTFFTHGRLCLGLHGRKPWLWSLSADYFAHYPLTKVRKMIIESIPGSLRAAISAGIGVFLAYVGIKMLAYSSFPIMIGAVYNVKREQIRLQQLLRLIQPSSQVWWAQQSSDFK